MCIVPRAYITCSYAEMTIFLIMPAHPHQAGVTRILKSSPACQSSYIFTRISALPNISMSVNSEREKFSLLIKLKFGKLPSRTAVTWHATDILTYVTFTISFSVILFSIEILLLYISSKVSHSAKCNMTTISKFLWLAISEITTKHEERAWNICQFCITHWPRIRDVSGTLSNI